MPKSKPKSDWDEQAQYEAGVGVWFRNSDNKQIVVKGVPHPVNLWYDDEEEGQVVIYKEDLERDYHRLRL